MKFNEHTQRQLYGFVFLALTIVIILYGTTYQQFRHFDIDDPRGIADIYGYIDMAHGNFSVDPLHRYRPIIPWIAGAISNVIEPSTNISASTDALSFYIVNFLFTVVAGIFLFYFLINVTGSLLLSFIGLMFFLASRHTIIACATPIVDSFFLCSIAAFAWLVTTKRVLCLALCIPLMAWSKELMIPMFFLPFVCREFWKWYYVLGVLGAFVSLWALRFIVGELYAEHIVQYERLIVLDAPWRENNPWETQSILHIFLVGWNGIQETGENIFTLRWLHAVHSGFSLVLPLAVVGVVIYFRRKTRNILLPITLLFPLSIVYLVTNEAGGRTLFYGFPAIILFALIAVREILKQVSYTKER